MVNAPQGEKCTNLVKRDVYGRVRHAWAREAKVVNCDPLHCKGVWKPPPERQVNRSSGQVLAGAVQRARRKHEELPREKAPELVGNAHRVGNAHQAFIREMRELEQKKLGEPRPATVPAMNVPQAFHVQRFFDRAAHHGEAAVGMRTRRAEADKKDPRQPFDRTQRLGHTQHRTEIDIDARMDDVWGAFHMGRGLKQGQLAGSNYIEKYHGDTEVKVYVGNLSKDADMNELKEMLGLNKQEIILSDPQAAAASKLFWFERPRESNFCLLVTRDAKLAGRVVKYCKSKSCKLRGHLLRVDFVVKPSRPPSCWLTGVSIEVSTTCDGRKDIGLRELTGRMSTSKSTARWSTRIEACQASPRPMG
uniref:Uncharacterized protein n=1 Tax=Guillardia theta TaxID=55529 RepID=A0A7S4UDA9_GUITH